jgi:apolipoprotein N-acyltransferase
MSIKLIIITILYNLKLIIVISVYNTLMNNQYIKNLLFGLAAALFFSAFIYLEHFGLSYKLLNTLLALAAFSLILYMPKKSILVFGFLTGLLWFYWIGYSFEYQGVGYMTPIITFGFGVIYMLFFGVLALTNQAYIRAILLFGLSFFEPFDWNWLQVELIFVDSYIGVFKYQLALVLFALSLPPYIKTTYRYAPLLIIFLALNYQMPKQNDAPLKIKLVATDIKQENKWLRESLKPTVLLGYKEIQKATYENYDVIIFPESFFPLYMNKNPKLIEQLLLLSKNITIVTGSLLLENNKHYNVTYMFQDGRYEVAKKLVLVPFGEYIPLRKRGFK